MPIDIPTAIAAVNGGIELAKGLATTSAELDKAELKLQIVGLVDQLVTAKDSLVDSTVPDSFQNTNSINGFRGLFGLNRAII
jgi:hypothetical protein